ncbi:MAG: hypothetical protein WCO24_00125, partial [Actinomycetes bacterium]
AWAGDFNAGEPATAEFFAKAPMAVTSYELLSNKVMRVMASANRSGCNVVNGIGCIAKQFTYTTQLAIFKNQNSLRIINGRGPLNGYGDEFGSIYFDNLLTNLNSRDSMHSMILTPKTMGASKQGIYPVYLYSQLPRGASSESIRRQAGFPARK